jgi:hypothetical protein
MVVYSSCPMNEGSERGTRKSKAKRGQETFPCKKNADLFFNKQAPFGLRGWHGISCEFFQAISMLNAPLEGRRSSAVPARRRPNGTVSCVLAIQNHLVSSDCPSWPKLFWCTTAP